MRPVRARSVRAAAAATVAAAAAMVAAPAVAAAAAVASAAPTAVGATKLTDLVQTNTGGECSPPVFVFTPLAA
jgi:hypothetical protein